MVLTLKSSVPGLARGLEVLNLLLTPRATEEVVRATGIPKSSVMRILATLRDAGLVERNGLTHTYRATMHLVPRDAGGGDAFEAALSASLARMASQTGHTAEWWLPTPAGQVLAQRHTPPQSEVHVRSWIGQVKSDHGHLDAVCCVNRAYWAADPRPGEKFWVVGPDLNHAPLKHADVKRRLEEARERGYAQDEHFNSSGIRRLAAAVWGQSQPVGTLALAQCNVPGLESQTARHAAILLRESRELSAEAKTKLERVERSSPDNLDELE